MDQHQAAEVLRNLDLRTRRMEQLLPDLPTREEMRAATAAAVAPLATKEALAAAVAPLATREELAAAVARLATKEELAAAVEPLATKQELREVRDELRGHMDVWAESLRTEMRLYMEAAKAWNEQAWERYGELKEEIRQLTGRLERSEAEIRADVERWLGSTTRSIEEIQADIARLTKTGARQHAESMKKIEKLEIRVAKVEGKPARKRRA